MKPSWKKTCIVCIVWLAIGTIGCASTPQPFDYHDDRDEKSGPGLFSGEEGGFIIHGGAKADKKAQADPPNEAE